MGICLFCLLLCLLLFPAVEALTWRSCLLCCTCFRKEEGGHASGYASRPVLSAHYSCASLYRATAAFCLVSARQTILHLLLYILPFCDQALGG
jgi:hypothetical protein